MDTRAPRVLDLKMVVITVTCLAGAGAGSFLLYRDFTSGGAAGLGPSLASVERREAKVRRKASTSYVWNLARENESLYRRDSLQTGPASAASVKFKDGTQLELGENSLVVIDDLKNLALNVARGSLVLRQEGGDSQISIGQDGKARVERLLVRLVSPESLARYFVAEKAQRSVEFAWQPRGSSNEISSFEVQLSTDKRFLEGQTTLLKPADKANRVSAQLGEGLFFWRVVGDGRPLTETSQFRVLSAVGLRPIGPANGQKTTVWGEDDSVQFKWARPVSRDAEALEQSLASGSHQIEIAADAEFTKVVHTQKIEATAVIANIDRLPYGKLFWRLKSNYADLVSLSRSEAFTVEKAKNLVLEPNKPENDALLKTAPLQRFIWSADSTKVDYTLEVQNSDNKTIISTQTRATTQTWKDALPGLYRWRVLADFNGRRVGETQWRGFSIFAGEALRLATPGEAEKIHYWKESTPFVLSWERDPIVDDPKYGYLIEVSKDQEFRNTEKEKTTALRTREVRIESAALGLLEGTYFWRVRIVSDIGRVLKASKVQTFTYGIYPPLRAPASAQPAPNTSINLVELEKDPTFSWSPVEGASAYEVSVASGGRVVVQKRTDKTSLEVQGLKPGPYTWTVRAIDQIDRRGEALPAHSLSVTYGEPLIAPEITSPEVQ